MKKQYYNTETYEARNSIGYLIRRARNLISTGIQARFTEQFKDKEITFVQWVILMCLRDNLANTASDICQYICYDTGAITRVIDHMEDNGLLKRKRSTRDRRVVELHLTAAGHKMIKSLMVVVVAFYNEMLEDFSREEADQLIKLLTKLLLPLSRQTKTAN